MESALTKSQTSSTCGKGLPTPALLLAPPQGMESNVVFNVHVLKGGRGHVEPIT